MKMKLRYMPAIALAAMMVFSAAGAMAGGMPGKGCNGGSKEARFEKMAEELGLTAEQKAKLGAHKESFMPRAKALKEKIRAAREALKNELDKPVPDNASIASLVAELKGLAGEQIQLRVDKVLEMKKVLTREQYAKMKDMMEKGKEEFRSRRENGGAGHDVI